MTINEAERYLRIKLGGMKRAVRYWKNRDKEKFNIEQTKVKAIKTALEIMRKYQKIEQIIRNYDVALEFHCMGSTIDKIREVIKDGNDS